MVTEGGNKMTTKIEYTEHVPAEIVNLIDAIVENTELAIKKCTVRGLGKKIKTNKPTDGIYAYVWRMARFHSGADMHIPTTHDWDLTDGIEARTGIKVYFDIASFERKAILDALDKLAERVVVAVGGDPNAAAIRWGRAFGII